MKPHCYNRPPFRDSVIVQDGWIFETILNEHGEPVRTRLPRMVEINDDMSKNCQQHGPMGEATLHGWDCTGCRHKPEDKNDRI